ncbi:hypothetical protein D1007_29583 [Hordeum vulgare]|nr:hypothetical protein D1007_29583 [Hordeum vulgare]
MHRRLEPLVLKTMSGQMEFLISTTRGMEKNTSNILLNQKSLESIVETKFHDLDVKACEIGPKYTKVESEKNQLQLDYDALKKTLEDKVKVLAKLKETSEADEEKLADFSKLVDENAKLKKERLECEKA